MRFDIHLANFAISGTWVERGRGTLRLNDKQMDNKSLQSRLVMRTQGCLRVILNTKVTSIFPCFLIVFITFSFFPH